MTNKGSGNFSTSGNVVYDSSTDAMVEKKRTVGTNGVVSVAERARLFGPQISAVSRRNNSAISDEPTRKIPYNSSSRSTTSNMIDRGSIYEPLARDIERRPTETALYSNTQRIVNSNLPPLPTYDRPKREQSPPNASSNSSILSRSHNYNRYPQIRQRPPTNYEKPRNDSAFKQIPKNAFLSQIKTSGDSILRHKNNHEAGNDDAHSKKSNNESNVSSHYEKISNNKSYQSSNYFRPIQDPLDVFYQSPSHEYPQQTSRTREDQDELRPFDLGNLIHRIQQDYVDRIQPYTSSVQFIESPSTFANIGFLTPLSSRKGNTSLTGYSNLQQTSSNNYEIAHPDNYYSRRTNPFQTRAQNQYSSITRRKHSNHYSDRASSPIKTVENTKVTKAENQPENKSPVKTTNANTSVTNNEEEDEEEEEEEEEEDSDDNEEAPALEKNGKVATTAVKPEGEAELGNKPSITSPKEVPSPSAKSGNYHPTTIGTPTIRSTTAPRPVLSTQALTNSARPSVDPDITEDSESEESESGSDSDSDDDKKRKTKKKSSSNTYTSNVRTTVATPRTNERGAQQQPAVNEYEEQQFDEAYEYGDMAYPEGEYYERPSLGNTLKSIATMFRRNKVPKDQY